MHVLAITGQSFKTMKLQQFNRLPLTQLRNHTHRTAFCCFHQRLLIHHHHQLQHDSSSLLNKKYQCNSNSYAKTTYHNNHAVSLLFTSKTAVLFIPTRTFYSRCFKKTSTRLYKNYNNNTTKNYSKSSGIETPSGNDNTTSRKNEILKSSNHEKSHKTGGGKFSDTLNLPQMPYSLSTFKPDGRCNERENYIRKVSYRNNKRHIFLC